MLESLVLFNLSFGVVLVKMESFIGSTFFIISFFFFTTAVFFMAMAESIFLGSTIVGVDDGLS
jgi:hypothetical protein